MNSIYRILAAATVVVLSTVASAQVAFNDFGAGHGGFDYFIGIGWTVSGQANGSGLQEKAMQFTSSATGIVADVILPMNLSSGSGNVQIQLVNDSGNTVGSTVLETWTMGTTGTFGNWNPPATLMGDGSASLASLTKYWLVARVENEQTSNLGAAWNMNNINASGLIALNGGSGWTYQTNAPGAFRVDVRATQTITASTTTLSPGIVVSGTPADLNTSNDVYYTLRPGVVLSSSQSPIVLNASYTLPGGSASALGSVVESRAQQANIRQTIDAFNFSTSIYVQLNQQVLPTTTPDTVVTSTLNPPANFIGAGNEVRLKISYKAVGPILSYPWQVFIDEATLRFTP